MLKLLTTNNQKKKAKLIYKVVWIIDEDESFVVDDTGSSFRFFESEYNILKDESVNDFIFKLKPLYACFSFDKVNK